MNSAVQREPRHLRSVPASQTADAAADDSTALTPLAAAHIADAALIYWRAALASGDIERGQPFDILDQNPGAGSNAVLLLQALAERQTQAGEDGLVVRYLAVAPQRATVAQWRARPELQALLAQGRMVPLLWAQERDDPCLMLPSGRVPWQAANPLVVVAHNCWSQWPQVLLAAHYGRLLAGELCGSRRPVG